MFVGHFGIAQFGKAARREIPLAWLLVAAYLPDFVRVLITPFTAEHEAFSHSIPAIIALSLLIGAVWQLRGGNLAAAAILASACLLHWPADVFTGCKPTTPHGPWIGFIQYRRPINDLLLEGGLLVGGWFAARRHAVAVRPRWIGVGIAAQVAFLVATYAQAEFFIGNREWVWRPRESLTPVPHALETTPCRGPMRHWPETFGAARFH